MNARQGRGWTCMETSGALGRLLLCPAPRRDVAIVLVLDPVGALLLLLLRLLLHGRLPLGVAAPGGARARCHVLLGLQAGGVGRIVLFSALVLLLLLLGRRAVWLRQLRVVVGGALGGVTVGRRLDAGDRLLGFWNTVLGGVELVEARHNEIRHGGLLAGDVMVQALLEALPYALGGYGVQVGILEDLINDGRVLLRHVSRQCSGHGGRAGGGGGHSAFAGDEQ